MSHFHQNDLHLHDGGQRGVVWELQRQLHLLPLCGHSGKTFWDHRWVGADKLYNWSSSRDSLPHHVHSGWSERAGPLTTHVYFQPLQGELTERLAKDVKDGGRFDWEKDLPSAIERMLHGKSEQYAFMAAIQAMYGETRKPQFSIKIRVSICLSQRLSGGRVLSLRQELVTKSRARQGSYSSFYDGQ